MIAKKKFIEFLFSVFCDVRRHDKLYDSFSFFVLSNKINFLIYKKKL